MAEPCTLMPLVDTSSDDVIVAEKTPHQNQTTPSNIGWQLSKQRTVHTRNNNDIFSQAATYTAKRSERLLASEPLSTVGLQGPALSGYLA